MRISLAALAAMSVGSSVIHALEARGQEQRLETVVVTATSREQPVQDVQASVQVISRKDLEGFSGTTVSDVLKMAAGVDARDNGANSTIAIRGFINNAGSPALILIDGLQRTSKYATTNLNLIPLEDIERIEIVRGPMSALYGAGATGGVVNIITKSPFAMKGFGGTLKGTLGAVTDHQRETAVLGATLRHGGETFAHRLSVEQRKRGLYRYSETNPLSDLSRIDETYLTYDGGARFGGGHALRWTFEFLDQRDTSPGLLAASPPARPVAVPFEGKEKERRGFGALRYVGDVGPGTLSVDLARGNSDASTTRSFPTIETTDYTQTQLLGRYALTLGAHSIVTGLGGNRDDTTISINSRSAVRNGRHVLVQDEWRISPAWKVLLGLRHDTDSAFDSVTTPRASVGYTTGPIGLRVGYGEAYRAPSDLELYSRFTRGRFLILGSQTLRPETNRTWEAAASYNTRRLSSELVVFKSNVTDLVQSVSSPALAGDPVGVTLRSTYSNVAKASLDGIEASTTFRPTDAWALTGGWDYLDAKDGTTGARLTQRARNTLRFNVQYSGGPWRVDVRNRYVYDFYNGDPVTRGPAFNSSFGMTDLKVHYDVTKAFTLAVGLDNIFDRRAPVNYASVSVVVEPPGRFLYLTGNYRF